METAKGRGRTGRAVGKAAGLASAFLLLSAAAFGAGQGGGAGAGAPGAAAAGFDVRRALKDLKSSDAQARMTAAKELGDHRSAAAVPELLKALDAEKQPMVRQNIVLSLGVIGDKRAVPRLLDMAEKSSSSWERSLAVGALHRLGDPAAWAPLEKLAGDPAQPAAVRRGCLIVTAAHQGADALKTLQAAVREKDPEVRRAAVDALGLVDQPEARAEIGKAVADEDAGVRAAARRLVNLSGKRAGKEAEAGAK